MPRAERWFGTVGFIIYPKAAPPDSFDEAEIWWDEEGRYVLGDMAGVPVTPHIVAALPYYGAIGVHHEQKMENGVLITLQIETRASSSEIAAMRIARYATRITAAMGGSGWQDDGRRYRCAAHFEMGAHSVYPEFMCEEMCGFDDFGEDLLIAFDQDERGPDRG